MSKQQEPSAEFLQKSLSRLRKRLTYVQDEMDITSFAIRNIENQLESLKSEEGKEDENA
jgi:hypothetical protein